jgi:hypothetical protein
MALQCTDESRNGVLRNERTSDGYFLLQAILRSPTVSNRAIAALRSCSHSTIAKYRARIDILGLTAEDLDRMSDTQVRIWLNGSASYTRLEPARPYKPKDKPSVERLVRDVQELLDIFLEDRPLMTIDEINDALLGIVEKINARPERSGLDESRRNFFERVEREEMKSVNPRPFDFFVERRFKKVSRDYYLPFDKAYYMVPWQIIGKPAILHAKHDTIEIFHEPSRSLCPWSNSRGQALQGLACQSVRLNPCISICTAVSSRLAQPAQLSAG